MDGEDEGAKYRGMPSDWQSQSQQGESCHVRSVAVADPTQVVGNLHFSHGRTFQNNMMQIQDLVRSCGPLV
jgi:hypothetical protein